MSTSTRYPVSSERAGSVRRSRVARVKAVRNAQEHCNTGTLEPIAQKMNEMAQKYYDTSRPAYCARYGFVDEIVNLAALRGYLKAFAGAVYQNPESICPRHQLMLPRIIRG